ncbi:Uma2 family endonuclease [Euhalothece natronophila Z-M001]|uniref:Uma2 family endonuclease n=1 Tax=Euhalothece natronophila Z-M001 TaxID=522448 RepID=A0A5B8NIF5_9CHRO|nr:Uma2 family endonuclease [Euhalothece natronophila]QDZ39013.1 Uma2 family endonuclease [Euhalothece natronophila Z-M001]
MTTTLEAAIAEHYIQLHPVSWETFNQLLEDLGDNRNKRLTYYQKTLQVMSPLGQHENNNRFIDDLIRAITDELGLNLKKFGSLTLKSKPLQQGVEADSCHYIKNEFRVRGKQKIDLEIDPPPDLVLEIDITSGSLNKLPIYANFRVPEVWQYKGDQLKVFLLEEESKTYQEVKASKIFPFLDLNLIPKLIQQSLEIGETATLKQFRQWVRENAA